MQRIDFYELARPSQERFVGSVNGTGLPAPILRAPFVPPTPRLWLAGSAACIVVFVLVLFIGYGSLTSGRAVLGVPSLVCLVLLAAGAVFGVLRAAAIRQEHRGSPFRRGVYVFPVGLVDARTSVLVLHPIESFGGVFGPDVRGLTLDFGGKSFSFPVTDPAQVATAKEAIESARSAVTQAGQSTDSVRPKALAALDPLQGYANPLVSSEKMVKARLPWATFAWAIALGAGIVAGGVLWVVRNVLSDGAMYAHAVAGGDTGSFRAYLEKGSRHAVEVSTVLLPRALLREAEAEGTVTAIEQFIADQHPTGAVLVLANASLRAALLKELAEVSKAGTLAALADFAARHPGKEVLPELAVARHKVYEAALLRFAEVSAQRKKAPADDSESAEEVVARLVAWSEQHGPNVLVRFHSQRGKNMDKADRAASQSRQFRGVVSLPSRYFDDAADKPERDTLLAAISKRFAEVFPAEILSFVAGEPLTDPDAPLPVRVTAPTLFIEQRATWAGSIQASVKPRGVFVGLELGYEAVFRVPDDARKPLTVKLDLWRQPGLAAAIDAEKPEDAIYGAMRQGAEEGFQIKLLAAFFRAK